MSVIMGDAGMECGEAKRYTRAFIKSIGRVLPISRSSPVYLTAEEAFHIRATK